MIRIAVAEGQQLREEIRSHLTGEADIQLVTVDTRVSELLGMFLSGYLNVSDTILVLDIDDPATEGLGLISNLKKQFPTLKAIAQSIISHETHVIKAFRAGAAGYFLNDVSAEEFVFGIRYVSNSSYPFVCCKIIDQLLDKQLQRSANIPCDLPELKLSSKESEILELIADGLTNQEIADKIFSSKRTVEGYRQNLIVKTRSRNSASLIKYAVLTGIIK